ncbi:MAG: hypothetical protein ABW026_07720 [Microvirga sp.]
MPARTILAAALATGLAAALAGCTTPVRNEGMIVTPPGAVPVPAGPPGAPSGAGRQILADGRGGFVLPDGTTVPADAGGGFTLPNGARVVPDGMGGITLPNGSRCVANGAGGYRCP